MKRMPPRSRRLCSQPLSRTSVPTSEERSSPQVWDLYRCIVVHPVFADRGLCPTDLTGLTWRGLAVRVSRETTPAYRGLTARFLTNTAGASGGSLRSPLLTVGQCALASP